MWLFADKWLQELKVQLIMVLGCRMIGNFREMKSLVVFWSKRPWLAWGFCSISWLQSFLPIRILAPSKNCYWELLTIFSYAYTTYSAIVEVGEGVGYGHYRFGLCKNWFIFLFGSFLCSILILWPSLLISCCWITEILYKGMPEGKFLWLLSTLFQWLASMVNFQSY